MSSPLVLYPVPTIAGSRVTSLPAFKSSKMFSVSLVRSIDQPNVPAGTLTLPCRVDENSRDEL